MSRTQDVIGIIRGLQCVADAAVKLQEESFKQFWSNSSIRNATTQVGESLKAGRPKDLATLTKDLGKTVNETAERVSTVLTGIREYTSLASASNLSPKGKPNDIQHLKGYNFLLAFYKMVSDPVSIISFQISYNLKSRGDSSSGLKNFPKE